MTTTKPDSKPATAGLPTEAELLKWAVELCGDELAIDANAAAAPAASAAGAASASSGTDWDQIANLLSRAFLVAQG